MPTPEAASRLDAKRANVLYHDAAAAAYDEKWAISFEQPAVSYVRDRAARMLPGSRYGRVLEIGAGTGFFIINLWQAGLVEEAHATDISTRMLEVCRRNAGRVGCGIEVREADAERLPYEDASFDLVVGHAVLHHLPDPLVAFGEAYRVLRPGGALFIAGEPTRLGDRLASVPKAAVRTTFRTAARVPVLSRISRAATPPPPPASEDERILRELEFDVDLHTFAPSEVVAWARDAGFTGVRVETEELVSSLFGWAVRTAEAEIRPGLLGRRWARFAYRSYVALARLDRGLYRLLPKHLFYNMLLYAERPEA